MSIVLQGSTSGSITLQEPAVAGSTVLTLPATTGTVVVSGTTPSFNGITFPATQSASTDANTLDDYEEGTWTPVFSAGTINGAGKVYSGTYTKIGRLVTLTFLATATDQNLQVVGYASFTGMPFTSAIPSAGAATTEDIDIFARNGFCETLTTSATFYLSACGSAGGTNNLYATVTYFV